MNTSILKCDTIWSTSPNRFILIRPNFAHFLSHILFDTVRMIMNDFNWLSALLKKKKTSSNNTTISLRTENFGDECYFLFVIWSKCAIEHEFSEIAVNPFPIRPFSKVHAMKNSWENQRHCSRSFISYAKNFENFKKSFSFRAFWNRFRSDDGNGLFKPLNGIHNWKSTIHFLFQCFFCVIQDFFQWKLSMNWTEMKIDGVFITFIGLQCYRLRNKL